jgi:hypothetical protein
MSIETVNFLAILPTVTLIAVIGCKLQDIYRRDW